MATARPLKTLRVQFAFDPDSHAARRFKPPVAQVVGETVDEIIATAGACPPDALVEAARPHDAPLHSLFEWDNRKAGVRWRRHQARALIASVRIVRPDKTVANEPVFVSIVMGRRDPRGYRRLVEVVKTPRGFGAALQQALDQLHALERRYANIEALKPVWAAIHAVVDDSDD